MTIEGLASSSLDGDQGPIFRFRCAACSYGASRTKAPHRCPMCGGAEWDHERWRPFSRLAADLSVRKDDLQRVNP
jgi:rubredoxin